MNRAAFFATIRISLFAGKLTQGVVDTVNTILTECQKRGVHDYRYIAYILATAYAESYNTKQNPEWLPVREGFAATNAGAIAAVTELYKAKKIKTNYVRPNKKGLSYYARGWVGITWEGNYVALGKIYGIPLADNPEIALQRPYAALLLVDGMVKGWYTRVKLSTYITDINTDFEGCRRIINGTDKAELIAGIAEKFYTGLIQL